MAMPQAPGDEGGPSELEFSVPVANRRLPTRVSNACRRCRRNKSRCDSFRPCSLCLRANVDCEPAAPADEPRNSRARAYSQRRGARLQRRRPESRDSSGDVPSTPASSFSLDRHVVESVGEEESGSTKVPDPTDRRTSWVPVDYGESESAMGIARKMYRLGSQSIDHHPTSAIPDGAGWGARTPQRRASDKHLPISTILGSRFPDQEMMYSLLEEYFESVHWFSLVIYEPKFRKGLLSIKDCHAHPAEAPFLILLSMVLCMAAWYRYKRAAQDGGEEWHLWSDDLLRIVESRLVQIMDQNSIAAVQTLILLGSHHVYHGRPNLSFALLGATIKLSHAMGLHRTLTRGATGDIEERKRVWWTIYTWDRFASISYGRPLSINDEDCNLEMPTEFTESPHFLQESIQQGLPGVVYSSYQTELSKLYLIASPALKTIFGSLSARSAQQHFESKYASLVTKVTQRLDCWRRQLPRFLSLDLNQDYHPGTTGWSIRAHLLQSLSLQLTFDNLLIVLHRPFLARQVEHLSAKASVSETTSPLDQTQSPALTSHSSNLPSHHPASPSGETTVSSEDWWNAAVRTVRMTELPQLAQLATNSHLVAFMAMNLFHASIVLILVALSDPLSDPAQGIKRTITRVFRLQQLLGHRSALSSQSSIVLENLIRLLLRREGEAMLGPVTSGQVAVDSYEQPPFRAPGDGGSMSVEDTLRLPLETAFSTSSQGAERQVWPNHSMMQRFNESLASVQRSKHLVCLG
ncbi:fungal-specific transcription factor domain-containing protein [Ilyonectria sp. MPI-CAGE-AT-0026]|nr:fungal-specific transcription factor domain-containing protein [Ilyonectria sp. MPI-CAGE-AT-0026]